LDESFEAALANSSPAFALGIKSFEASFMPENALPMTLNIALDHVTAADMWLVISNQFLHAVFPVLAELRGSEHPPPTQCKPRVWILELAGLVVWAFGSLGWFISYFIS
jgi:hypothetical protein